MVIERISLPHEVERRLALGWVIGMFRRIMEGLILELLVVLPPLGWIMGGSTSDGPHRLVAPCRPTPWQLPSGEGAMAEPHR